MGRKNYCFLTPSRYYFKALDHMYVRYFCIFLLSLIYIKSINSQILDNELSEDVESYCKYITEKNKAKSNLLLSPDIIVRAQNSNNEELVQNNVVAGLSELCSNLVYGKIN